jgi:hypothetical protein
MNRTYTSSPPKRLHGMALLFSVYLTSEVRNVYWLGDVEWIQLAQDRDRWRAVVNTVMNLRVLTPRGYYVSEETEVNIICIL